MKALIVLGCSLFAATTFAQTATPKTEEPKTEKAAKTEKIDKVEKPPITFKTLVIERPEIPYGSEETFDFEFKNTGKEPVMITDVRASCGCTTPQKPTEAVQKGKSDKIVVRYDTKRQGPFTKTITVTTNVTTEPIILTIKGTVLPPVVEEKTSEDHTH